MLAIRAAQSSVSKLTPFSLLEMAPTMDIYMRDPSGWVNSCDLFLHFMTPKRQCFQPVCSFPSTDQTARPLATVQESVQI